MENILFTALPILAAATVVYLVGGNLLESMREKRGSARSQASAEGFAKRLGLSYKPNRMLDELGHLEGVIKGHQIRMFIYRPGKVDIRWSKDLKFPIDLSTKKPDRRPEDGMETFATSNKKFDATFEQRYASSKIGKVFSSNSGLTDALMAFTESGSYKQDEMRISEYGIDCSLADSLSYDEQKLTDLFNDSLALIEKIQPLLNAAHNS